MRSAPRFERAKSGEGRGSASSTGSRLGQTKLRKERGFGKGEQHDGQGPDGRSRALGSEFERKRPTDRRSSGLRSQLNERAE